MRRTVLTNISHLLFRTINSWRGIPCIGKDRCSLFLFSNGKIVKSIEKEEKKQVDLTKQEVLKTYLQIIPPYRIESIVNPSKTDITQYTQKASGQVLSLQQTEKLYKKIKKSVHIIPIQELGRVLQVISQQNPNQSKQIANLNKKIYTKMINIVRKKMDKLSLEQIVDYMYKLVKLNYKQFQFMKQIQRVLIQQKIPIKYPFIRKILFSYTHLDVGSAVLYTHVAKTIKIGQYQLSPLELAQSAYMLSKSSENGMGGYGVFSIAEHHLLSHLPRLDFHDLVKAASYMLTQNIGSNQFQTELQSQLYKKYPDKSTIRINDIVTLLKATSGYYFKYKQKALLNMLQTSTMRIAHDTKLQQFEDIIWSWGRAGKGDRQLWTVLQEQIYKKYINLLKTRQLSFFYYSLCSTEYSSAETITLLQKKFLSKVSSEENTNQHYLIKFLLGMQKRKDYSQKSFVIVSKLLTDKLTKLSTKQLTTFAKIINESDLCYENKEHFKQMEKSLLNACRVAIAQKIYLFRINEIVEILYMWIKLDVSAQSQNGSLSNNLTEYLFSQIENSTHQIPKSVFIKAFFCFTIKDKYKQAIQMVIILQQLMKYGPIAYFFSPYDLPLAAYCIFHLVVNSQGKVQINDQLIAEMGEAIQKMNPLILNKFVRNGYEQCLRLMEQYEKIAPQYSQNKLKKRRKRV